MSAADDQSDAAFETWRRGYTDSSGRRLFGAGDLHAAWAAGALYGYVEAVAALEAMGIDKRAADKPADAEVLWWAAHVLGRRGLAGERT